MARRARVLYVDDDADIRGIVEYALEDEPDMLLELSASGQEALRKIDSFMPDIILLDVMMPGLDGPGTLKRLREKPQSRNTPVIFITAKVQPSEVDHLKRLGAIEVVAKPFDPISLSGTIRKFLELEATQIKSGKSHRIQQLRKRFHAEMPARVGTIKSVWNAIEQTSLTDENITQLHLTLHSLAGSSLSFGYDQIGNLAKEIEAVVTEIQNDHGKFDDAAREQINRDINQLLALTEMQQPQPAAVEPAGQYDSTEQNNGLVYVVDSDAMTRNTIASQLHIIGLEVKKFSTLADARTALAQTLPAMIIIDAFMTEDGDSGIEMLNRLPDQTHNRITKIVLSAKWDWESRLAAARAGIVTFLQKPLDISQLIECIQESTLHENNEPYRVLIVEDTMELAFYYASVLEDAGMVTEVVTEPSELLDRIADFHPELVLMDLYMPGCSGIEASRVIRQDRKFLSVPIVFLSSEAERVRQLGAMQTGADDFLVKPISDMDLIHSVRIRAKRFRNLASLIRQDSLTGLLNHNSFKMQMDSEYARMQRTETNLIFALIDIDHFKQVNDTYGHPAGDRVLKSIAHLLTTRLRKSDVIGRYGGEEFGILMPDTTLEQAYQVIDDLRLQFSMIAFATETKNFTCTFSAGLSMAPPYASIDQLITSADKALYQAKDRGRNCICSDPAWEPPAALPFSSQNSR